MIIQAVRFKSALSEQKVLELYEARSPRYRMVPGLAQKYYLSFRETGEHGAVYLWESEEALLRFRESDLARTIASAYQVQGEPDIRVGEVVFELYPHAEPAH